MTEIIHGNIFESKMDTLVCPVNCVGIMGAGLAKQFKQKYPNCLINYLRDCNSGKLQIGQLTIDTTSIVDHKIIFFPTKDHPANNSHYNWIEKGLQNFEINYLKWKVESVAFPLLGAGLGGLNQSIIKNMILNYIHDLPIQKELYV